MPLHHSRETYLSSGSLVETLRALGVGGVVYPGVTAWRTFPLGADPITITPNAASETDGAAATLIAAAAVPFPYFVTHFPFRSSGTGNFQVRFKLQDTAPVVKRVLRAYNDRLSAADAGIQSPEFTPFPVATNLGVQAIVATNPGGGPAFQGYATTLRQDVVQPVADLLAAAPVGQGGAFPAVSGGNIGVIVETFSATPWVYGNYVEITPGVSTPTLITAVWGNVVDALNHTQVTFATGASGGEVDWGTFAWPRPSTNDDADCRHDLLPFPFYLPANTRLAARARSSHASGAVGVDIRVSVEYVPVPLR